MFALCLLWALAKFALARVAYLAKSETATPSSEQCGGQANRLLLDEGETNEASLDDLGNTCLVLRR